MESRRSQATPRSGNPLKRLRRSLLLFSAVGIAFLQVGEGVKQVSYDEPMKYSEEPLAKMEMAE